MSGSRLQSRVPGKSRSRAFAAVAAALALAATGIGVAHVNDGAEKSQELLKQVKHARAYGFVAVMPPLKVKGGAGSALRALALVGKYD